MLVRCRLHADNGSRVSRYQTIFWIEKSKFMSFIVGGGPRVVVSTAAFHARVRGSVPGLGGLKETNLFLPHPRVKLSIVGSPRDREAACSASDRQDSNFESCVLRTVSSHSSHRPQEVLLAQFSQYVHKGWLKPDYFHFFLSLCSGQFIYLTRCTVGERWRWLELPLAKDGWQSYRFVYIFIYFV